MVNYDEWPIIRCPEDLPEDGSLDRMFAEWLVATGAIGREDFDLQVRLTRSNRGAVKSAMEDAETMYNKDSKIFSRNGVSWAQRTTPFKRGRHRKD